MAADVEHSFAVLAPFGGHETRYFRFPGGCYDTAALRAIADTHATVVQYDDVADARSTPTPPPSPPTCCGKPTTARSSSCTSPKRTLHAPPTRYPRSSPACEAADTSWSPSRTCSQPPHRGERAVSVPDGWGLPLRVRAFLTRPPSRAACDSGRLRELVHPVAGHRSRGAPRSRPRSSP